MKLYYAEVINPRKVCALAKHLNAPVEFIKVDVGKGEQRSAAFRARNPNGKVPVLEGRRADAVGDRRHPVPSRVARRL